jgi:hypothetical protein
MKHLFYTLLFLSTIEGKSQTLKQIQLPPGVYFDSEAALMMPRGEDTAKLEFFDPFSDPFSTPSLIYPEDGITVMVNEDGDTLYWDEGGIIVDSGGLNYLSPVPAFRPLKPEDIPENIPSLWGSPATTPAFVDGSLKYIPDPCNTVTLAHGHIEKTLVKLYDEFARVCYNDSTEIQYQKYSCDYTKSDNCFLAHFCTPMYDKKIVHKEPNDLKSFINYLRTK